MTNKELAQEYLHEVMVDADFVINLIQDANRALDRDNQQKAVDLLERAEKPAGMIEYKLSNAQKCLRRILSDHTRDDRYGSDAQQTGCSGGDKDHAGSVTGND